MPAGGPEVSVVVPVRDGARSLGGLLRSLDALTLARDRFEVFVVDNGSRDLTAEVAERAGASVVREPTRGRACARNAGAAQARSPLLAFVDADCTADAGWLEALVACLGSSPVAGGPVEIETTEPPNPVEQLELISRFDQERSVRDAGWAASANLGMSKEAFDAVGGFDESYRHIGEDVDLCLRAGAAGYPIAWCPKAVVRHAAESRVVPMLGRGFRHGYAGVQLRRRHAGRVGRAYWRHPGPLIRGRWALERFGVAPESLPPGRRQAIAAAARLEYGARIAGSVAALVRPR
jgi:glycosyltransferase involved in cell wall biosynthesis